jgi:Na+/melibiose symporter-like transporter
MERRKLEGAALFFAIFAVMLILPPLVVLFQFEQRAFGVPVGIIYLFVSWAVMIAGTWALSRRLPHEQEAVAEGEDAP